LKSDRRKRSNLQQPLSWLLKLKEMNPILKALLKYDTEKLEYQTTIASCTLILNYPYFFCTEKLQLLLI